MHWNCRATGAQFLLEDLILSSAITGPSLENPLPHANKCLHVLSDYFNLDTKIVLSEKARHQINHADCVFYNCKMVNE